jgi:hypothetical protein
VAQSFVGTLDLLDQEALGVCADLAASGEFEHLDQLEGAPPEVSVSAYSNRRAPNERASRPREAGDEQIAACRRDLRLRSQLRVLCAPVKQTR